MRSVSAPFLPPLWRRGVTAQTPGFAGRVIPTIPTTPFLSFVEICQSNTSSRPVLCAHRELEIWGDRCARGDAASNSGPFQLPWAGRGGMASQTTIEDWP